MTEEGVRAIFIRHYSRCGLNEALMATSEDVAITILSEGAGEHGLPDIISTINQGRSRIDLFNGAFASGHANPAGPMSYIFHFDHIRKAMLDAIVYMHDNYDTADPYFKEWFTKEDLKMMSGDMSEAIEKPTGLPANVRGINFAELKKEEEFFSFALVGILGKERFQKYAEEYNRLVKVLRQCQAECKGLRDMVDAKES